MNTRFQILNAAGLVENVIVLDPANAGAYAATLTEGRTLRVETPEHVHAPRVEQSVAVPEQVTNAQFREALIDAGIMPEQVDHAIEQIQDSALKAKAKSRWNFANHIERSNAFITMLSPAFGLSDAQVDDLFRAAATL